MKSHKRALLLLLMLIILVISSCEQFSTKTKTSPSISSTTQLPTLISIPTETPSALPTLLAEVTHTRLLDMLANNGNCRLPCLWGITPGQSTIAESQSILEPLINISGFTIFESSGGGINPIYVEGDLGIYTNVGYRADPHNNVISNISFHAQTLREISQGNYEELFGHPLYARLLNTYSLPEILSTYGPPADVLIRTNSELPPRNWGPFEILISYPGQGILVHYVTPMNPVDSDIVGCPAKSKLELYLVPSGKFNSTNELLESHAAPLKFEELFPGYRSIEEVTLLALDEFVSIFIQPTDQCLETPASYWPTP